MREGYKETEIGVIPVDWEVARLGSLGTTYSGLSGKTKDDFGFGKPFITYMNVFSNSSININMMEYVNISIGENQNTVQNGDILFTVSSETKDEVGMTSIVLNDLEVETYLNSFCFGFRLNTDDKLLPRFAKFLLREHTTRKRITFYGAGSTRINISKVKLMDLLLLIPPLKEQEKIADILSTADDKIDAIATQIEKAETLKKGLLQKLLSEGIGHSEFKDSELGKIPESWEVVKLGQISKIKDGTHFSPKSKNGSCKYVTSKNIKFGHFDETTISYISQEEHDEIYKRCPVKKGQVLLTKDGAKTGNACLNPLDEPFSLLSSVAVIDGKKDSLYNEYLLQWFLSDLGQNSLKRSMAGQAITRLTLTKISAHKLIFPPLKEQKKIANILSTADEKLEVLRTKKEKYETLKQGLMQKLLSGDLRVKI